MSDRRQQRRQERQSRRRQGGSNQTSYQPVAGPEFPGVMGVMQRKARFLLLGGVVVMVLSLGSIFFVTQLGGASPHIATGSTSDSGDENPAPVASGEPTSDATSDDPSDDEPAIVRSYSAAPPLEIDPELSYEAIITLETGEVRLELLPAEAPGYVNNFVFLARNQFYDGLTFHRVVPGFVAQGGDPTGNGAGSAGYNLVEESNSLTFGSGVLSMAKAGPTVNGSQFFITLGPAPHLDSGFTVFGRVIEGLELLQAFDERNPASSDEPGPTIISIEIIEGS